jgi:hypothetical protein
VNGSRHDEHILHAEVMRTLRDLSGQLDALRTLRRIIARQRIRPEEEGTQPADLDANLIGHLADL